MRIAVYHHAEDATTAENINYVLWAMCDLWREDGHEVEYLYGPRRVDADVAIIHVDRTIVPDEYFEAASDCPVVINWGSKDISKSVHCSHLIHSRREWDGGVIVKTSFNVGGFHEIKKRPRLRRFYEWRKELLGLGYAVWLDPNDYPIFGSTAEVPRRVFRNRHLVVQKFLGARRRPLLRPILQVLR